ncbi:A disintegrin and metalloproteinase with thrombospondin motifs 5-like [Leptopilina boulardi]|uniref:A disintegrin and metalloproteinase with thrombospondin motifs 5-like n=1 Tax=Leptopilina boulardi TaxID=63433 RepID=UPI0021F52284|nr:A disintegrin and metalloproteinase with thrombospondin motifs 5-like [Leptopilina boulardi]
MLLFQSNSVPKYEIVHIKHNIKKRCLYKNYAQVFLKTFNRSLTLYLKPENSVLLGKKTKVWSAEPNFLSPQGVNYKVISDFTNIKFKTLHDVRNKASVSMEEDDNGNINLFGHIGDDLVIKPLPQRMLDNHNARNRRIRDSFYYNYSQNNFWKIPWSQTTPHIVYKLPPVKYNKVKWPKKLQKVYQEYNKNKSSNSKVDIVYPEILLFVDNSLFNKLGRNVEDVKKYIATYWNAVDLRFRQLEDPMVRLNIAGIILSTGKREVPFIKNSAIEENEIDADKVLKEIGHHFLLNNIFAYRKDYDLFVTMTSRDMCNWESGFKYCDTMGYAYVAAACNILNYENNDEDMIEAVGMVEDNGGFKGIIPTAHEVGHLLGVKHDVSVDNNKNYLCEDGYIMHKELAFSDNSFDWSPCSLLNFTIHLNHPNTTCLRNKPNIGDKIENFLPGSQYSLEDQCQQFSRGSIPCKHDLRIKNVCMGLECYVTSSGECVKVAPAAEGSSCGYKSICLHGKCISSIYNNYETVM